MIPNSVILWKILSQKRTEPTVEAICRTERPIRIAGSADFFPFHEDVNCHRQIIQEGWSAIVLGNELLHFFQQLRQKATIVPCIKLVDWCGESWCFSGHK